MKFKRNFWQGYKGTNGRKLDQTECELYDDIPSEDQKELMLKLLAGGQVAEARKRAIYYDAEDMNCEDENEGNDKESFDYIQAYQQYKANKIEMFKKKQQQQAEQPPQQQAEQQPQQQADKPQEKDK